MALFKSIEEIRKYVAVNASMEFAHILPFINRAELLQIKPILGAALYAELSVKYEATPQDLSAKEVALLHLCQDCIANFSFLLYIPFALVQINGGGVHQTQNSTKKPASPEQIKKLETAHSQAGYQAIEAVLEYLDQQAEAFPSYDRSETSQILLNRTRLFNNFVNIGNSRRTFLALQPLILRVELGTIRKAIGPELFTELKAQHKTNTLTPENKLLLEYIYPATAYLAIASGITELSLAITDNGLNVFSSSTTFAQEMYTPAADGRLQKMLSDFEILGNAALQDLIKFLNKRLATYPLFETAETYQAPTVPIQINTPNASFYQP
ncbi:MAG: DUF6712 family protein [Adhaeribacter sp.]